MKPFTMYTADCRENQYNTVYPHRHVIHDADDLRRAVCRDQVFAEYRNHHRGNEFFIVSDCLPFDCDNDHSDKPEEWKTPADVATAFPGVAFYAVYSRHHMTEKGKYSPRPRFHILFPIDEIRDKEEYRQLKESVIAYFPYFDVGAKDSARFFYGVTDPVVEAYGGDTDGTE